jgi:hypothetical protein
MSHTGAWARPMEDQKQTLSDLSLSQIFLGDIMFTFPYSTIEQWNVVGFGVAANTTTEATS